MLCVVVVDVVGVELLVVGFEVVVGAAALPPPLDELPLELDPHPAATAAASASAAITATAR